MFHMISWVFYNEFSIRIKNTLVVGYDSIGFSSDKS
jgi:hypothetical protein